MFGRRRQRERGKVPVEFGFPEPFGFDEPFSLEAQAGVAIGERVFVADVGYSREFEECFHALELFVWDVDFKGVNVGPLGRRWECVVRHVANRTLRVCDFS